VVAQIYIVSKLTFYNMNRNRRLELSPSRHWLWRISRT